MNQFITLPDGRTLSYREFGAPDGFPVINNHGGLVCGLDSAPAHEVARELDIRILSPNRPGIDASSAKAGRTLLDWANDVDAFVDILRLDQFAVVGWSMGGQYALACAYHFGARVKATAVVAGCLPLNDAANFSELNHMDQRLTRMSQKHPHNAVLAFKALGEIAQHTPELWTAITARGLAKSDVETLHRLPEPGLAQMAAPALSSPEGMVEEYRAWALPWGFNLEQIRGTVNVWQGQDDTLVPPAWAGILAQRIPNACLHLIPGEGHMLAYNHYREILSELKG
jgi:pimeloyl-ACP methyl ester carboxylesterase